jgi:hypothetical protein
VGSELVRQDANTCPPAPTQCHKAQAPAREAKETTFCPRTSGASQNGTDT